MKQLEAQDHVKFRRRRVLIVSGVPIAPATAGNRRRIRSMVDQFRARGVEVYLILCGEQPGDEDTTRDILAGRYLYIEYQAPVPDYPIWLKLISALTGARAYFERFKYLRTVDDVYCTRLNEKVRWAAKTFEPDIAVVEYVYRSAALECLDDGVLKVIDSNDVLGGRMWYFWRRGAPANSVSVSKKEESRGFNRADVVLAIQHDDAEQFRTRTSSRVITYPHRASTVRAVSRSRSGGERMLFVGSDNYLNKRCIEQFILHCLPVIHRRKPGAVLEIIGSIGNFIAPVQGVEIKGIVDNLESAYRRADVVVNPVYLGTGLAIKNLEAMAFGSPMVVLGEAARGIDAGAGKAFLKAESWEDMAEQIVAVLVDPVLADSLSNCALRFARDNNERSDAVIDQLLSLCPGKASADNVAFINDFTASSGQEQV